MLDEHLGRISVVRQHIELFDEKKQPAQLAAQRPGPTSREFEKLEIEKKLSQKILESAQTKWAPSIVFAPNKKTKHYAFASNTASTTP